MGIAQGANIPFKSDFWSADSSGNSRASAPRNFEQTSLTGALGHPELTSPEKGEELFVVAVHELAAFIREFAQWSEYLPHQAITIARLPLLLLLSLKQAAVRYHPV